VSRTLWITGVAGFTGWHLCHFINGLTNVPRIVGLDTAKDVSAELDCYHRVDLTDMFGIEAIARKDPPKWVIHLAGVIPSADEVKMWRVNVGGTANLLAGLIAAECSDTRIVSIGSAAEYLLGTDEAITETNACGGTTPYGRTKWAQTCIIIGVGMESGLETMVVRPFNLIGPNLSSELIVGALCEQFSQEDCLEEIHVGNVKSARDFVDIRDAVEAYWLVAQKGLAGNIYNICSGRATSVEELVAMFCQLTGKSPRVCVDASRLRDNDPQTVCGDNSKLFHATGWQPRLKVRDSLADMLRTQPSTPCHEVGD